MKPENPKARARVDANVKVIRELLTQLEMNVERYDSEDRVDFGHVGDLAYIRGCLYQALGHEDNPDPV